MALACYLILLKLDRRYIEGQMRQIYFSGSLQCRAAGYLKMLGETSRVCKGLGLLGMAAAEKCC